MNHHSFERSDFDRGKIDGSALHLEMLSTFGADFSHVELRGDDVQVHFKNDKAIELVRAVVVAHRSLAVPFDPHVDVGRP